MNYIAYFRVSTQRQGESGLGLEAQQNCVNNFIKGKEGNLLASYTEVESGKKNNRIELNKALKSAKENNATIIIAKLDRLSRNAAFTLQLMESKVKFIACDMPDANHLTIGIIALLAQNEAKLISERTKAALAAKKARGFTLGTPENLTNQARAKGVEAIKEQARTNENNVRATGYIKMLREYKKLSFGKIAEVLNEEGYKTSRGKEFRATTVQRLLKRS